MAEQLILKGTLEGHVSAVLPPCRRQLRRAALRRDSELAIPTPGLQLTMSPAEWLGHQLGHVDGEVRATDQLCRRREPALTMTSKTAPTCSCRPAETRPSSSGTSPAMRPSTVTPSGRCTATPTSSPTAYVCPAVFWGLLLLESRGEGNWTWNWNRCADWRGR